MKSKMTPYKQFIIYLAVLVMAVIIVICYFNWQAKNKEHYQSSGAGIELIIDPDAASLDAEPTVNPSLGITIPGFTQIILPADTTEVGILLKNPGENSCNFVYELSLDNTGEILYTSNMVLPGTQIEAVKLSRPLSVGDYEALLRVYTYETDTLDELNGADIRITLEVVNQKDS